MAIHFVSNEWQITQKPLRSKFKVFAIMLIIKNLSTKKKFHLTPFIEHRHVITKLKNSKKMKKKKLFP